MVNDCANCQWLFDNITYGAIPTDPVRAEKVTSVIKSFLRFAHTDENHGNQNHDGGI